MRTRRWGAMFGAGLLLASGPALANGRYPAAQLLLTDPSDPDRLWVRGTQGVMTSADRGCTWHWICETALGYRGTEDPMLGVMADGTVIGGIFDGLVTSHNRGCDWSLEGPMERLNVVDLSVEKADTARALAISSNGDSTGRFVNQVWRTADSAATWTQLGPNLPADIIPLTIDMAPSDPRRLYISAFRYLADAGVRSENVLLYSDDDGASWTTRPMGAIAVDYQPYLSAIHPTDPDKLYVRLRDNDNPDRVMENRVVYSADGGRTWEEIFVGRADILGFALSPDGGRVALGLGNSLAGGARPVDGSVLGVYTASTTDHAFLRQRAGHVGCLTWTARGMYFCGSGALFQEGLTPFELALSTDEGVSITTVMLLAGIEGPLSCPAESQLSRVCDVQGDWPNVCASIGRCDFETGEVTQRPRGEICLAGSGGATGSAGTSGQGQGASAPDTLHIDDGCSISGTERSRDVALFALAALAALGGLHGARRYARRGC